MKNDDSLTATTEDRLTRKEQLTFITRLLSLVSHVTGRKFDVLISPSKILCGQDVMLTHQLLSALATIVLTTTKDNDDDEDDENNTISNAVKYVLEMGDVNLYKRGVRTRKAFTCMQAICRGWLVRQRQKHHEDDVEVSLVEKKQKCKEATIDGMAAVANEESECNSSDLKEDVNPGSNVPTQQKAQLKTSKSSKSNEQELLESYEAMYSRKVKVEEEIHKAENRLKRENDKLIRMLNLSLVHKTRTNHNPYPEMPRPPKSAPSIGRNIGNTMVKNDSQGNIDMAFADTITNFSERQRAMKQKERRIDERESRLKQRFARSKQKEADLKHQEARISDLAGKIRNQQIQLKEQKLQFERSKLLDDETTNTPLETTRPCLLCTEKKIQLREIRTKLRQRNRILSQREANVIERAHELRRREMQLVKREQSSKEQQSTSVTEDDSTSPDKPEAETESDKPPPPDTQQCQSHGEENEPIKKTTLSVVVRREASSNPPRKRHPRKRRRRSREGSSSSSTTNEIYINRKSMRASFGECTPIVEEETPRNAEQEDEHGVQNTVEIEIDGMVVGDIGQCSVEKRVQVVACDSEIIDINKARESLGIIKSKRNDAIQSNRKQQVEQTTTTTTKAQIPTATKRHVFAFEKQSTRLPSSDSHLSRPSNSALLRSSIRPSTRERDGRKPKQKQHNGGGDDWISSFDSQMNGCLSLSSDSVMINYRSAA